jgi:hypothetical protein
MRHASPTNRQKGGEYLPYAVNPSEPISIGLGDGNSRFAGWIGRIVVYILPHTGVVPAAYHIIVMGIFSGHLHQSAIRVHPRNH